MALEMLETPISDTEQCSTFNKRLKIRALDRAAWRALRVLSPQERSLLRLVFKRGASERELAALLGTSKTSVRRRLEQAVERATDPAQQALVTVWRQLAPYEQRLAYLHRVLGLSIRQIAHDRLIGPPPGSREGAAARASSLRVVIRGIDRKVLRLRRPA